MAKKHIIYFDASANKTTTGIGIYDSKYNNRIHIATNAIIPECSYTAETMALVATLQYLQKNSFYGPIILLTDNQALANKGISLNLLRKYNLWNVSLSWIPRELNRVADTLSKVPKPTKKSLTAPVKQHNGLRIRQILRTYPLEQRLDMLFRLANNTYQQAVITSFRKNEVLIPIAHNKKRRRNLDFLKLVCMLTQQGEAPLMDRFIHKHYTKRLKLTTPQMEEYLRKLL